jgi:hypothetical protein
MKWQELVRRAGWTRGQGRDPLCFIFCSDVSTIPEDIACGFDPSLSAETLSELLVPQPAWLRSDWLRTTWPRTQPAGECDLLYLVLLRAKATLAVGAAVPDGSASEMNEQFRELFPELGAACVTSSSHLYSTCPANVTMKALEPDHMGWGFGGSGREGLPLPVRSARTFGERSPFEIYLQNQMRIVIQKHLELWECGQADAFSAWLR